MKRIVNLEDLPFEGYSRGDKFESTYGAISPLIGAQKLGYNLTVVPPGKRAVPFHCHFVNEEMFFVIEGQGELRIGDQTHPIRQGDVIACPAGGAETAHQIINTSEEVLKYLAVSTQLSPELAYYPDSDKYASIVSQGEGEDGQAKRLLFVNKQTSTPEDYWDGE